MAGVNYIRETAPNPSDILGGSTTSTTSGATLVTIPAGRVWKGNVGLSFDQLGSTATNASIQTFGTGVVPPSGTVVVGAVSVSSTDIGQAGTNETLAEVYVAAPAGNSVSLVTSWSVAPTTMNAWATGILLPTP